MSEWRVVQIGNICSLIVDCVNRTAPAVEYKTPFKMIRTTNVRNGKINIVDAKFVTEDTYKKWVRRGKPEFNDIVLTREAPVGEVGIIKISESVFLGQRTMMYRANSKLVLPNFLYYSLLSPFLQGQIHSSGMGSVVEHIRVPEAKKFVVKLPPLPEQKAIAEVLSSLDDKIDLLHRQNKTLEQMAETLFRQWFVEEVQEDWEEGTLDDIINFNPRYRIVKGESAPYLEMKNVSTSIFNPEGWYFRDFTSGMKFQNGDSIIARITPCLENGKTSFIAFLEDGQIGWGSTEYIVMRMKEPFHKFISYLIAKDNDFRDFSISSMSGSSGRQRAQATTIQEYEFKIPTDEVIKKLNEQLDPIVKKLLYNAHQIPTLESLRDTLLPKLMSGEVRVQYNKEAVQ